MYGITVREFLDLFISPEEQQFELWSNEKEKPVFIGYLSDIPEEEEDELLEAEVTSVDNLQYESDCITLNID